MNANLENIAEELFGKIRTRFPEIKLGDESSNVIDNDENISQARFFEFDYIKEGVSLGSITIKLSEKDGMTVMYSNDIAEGQPQILVNEWYRFLRSLREFAGKRLLKFNTRDLVKSNLDKRDYNFLAKNNAFRGGAITPGIHMRLLSMHEHTDKLPLVTREGHLALLGYDTESSMRGGAINGITAEIDGMIEQFESQYGKINCVLTGGDATFFENRLKNKIFADTHFLFKGLYAILEKNN
jgi:hypothetical protein